MSETSNANFAPEDKLLFSRIRSDVLARPDFYRAGMEYLNRHWSPEAIHAAELADRRRYEDLDHKGASFLATVHTRMSSGPEHDDTHNDFTRPPEMSWLCNCLIAAATDLRQEGLGTGDEDLLTPYDLNKAKAVLFLTWLLTDPRANEHELGAEYGEWGADFMEEISLKGRAMAKESLFDGHSGRDWPRAWVSLAQQAWELLQPLASSGDDPTSAGGRPGTPIEQSKQRIRDRVNEGQWLIPTSLADLANRLGNIGSEKAKVILNPYGLRQAGNRQSWTVRLDRMPSNIRERLEEGR